MTALKQLAHFYLEHGDAYQHGIDVAVLAAIVIMIFLIVRKAD